MKKMIFIALSLFVLVQTASACTYPDDRAADGSRCGARASTLKPGGK